MKNLKSYFVGALALSAVFTFSNNLGAQGFYIDGSVGYDFPIGGSPMLTNESINSTMTGYSRTSEIVPLSLGKGINFGANVGYMFNKNIGVDLGYNYLMGSETTGTSSYSYSDGVETENEKMTDSYSANLSRITASFVLASGSEKLNPYARIGAVLTMGKMTNTSTYTSNSTSWGNSTGEYIEEYSKGMSLGFASAVGVTYPLTDKLHLLGEVNFTSAVYSPKHSEITKYEEDGINYLEGTTVSETQTDYENEITYSSGTVENPNEPSKSLKINIPTSSVGLKVGVRFNL